MNIVIAQIRKDLIPLRGLLIVMGALLALALSGRILEATGVASFSGDNFLGGIQFLLVAALIVRLIHLDSLANPGAFWRTRPILRSHLLSAKFAFLVLPCLALLALSDAPAPDSHGTPFSHASVVLAGLAAFASVTQRFSELASLFFKAALAAILTSLAASVLAAPVRWAHLDLTSFELPANILLIGANLLVFAGYLGVVVHQYLTLRTAVSIRAIYAIFIFATLVASLKEQIRG